MVMTKIKSNKEIAAMRTAGGMLATVLSVVKKQTKAGMTTKDLANIARDELKRLGGRPSFLGYQGFPEVICVSVNNQVVHGIPSKKLVLKDGDIVSIDFGVTIDSMITDSAISYVVGKSKDSSKLELLAATEQAMMAGIEKLKGGIRVGDISAAVQEVIDQFGYGNVRDLVGHGVGHELHELPNIPNYGKAGAGPLLATGMTIAIEPMVTLGTHKVAVDEDGWTIVTADGSLSAHFEHTVLITDTGYEILTIA